MARAGMLTYSLWQMWQALAVSGESCLWVCLWRDRLELVANCFPHSKHSCLPFLLLFSFDRPSLNSRESLVKDLMLVLPGERDDSEEKEESEQVEEAGERGEKQGGEEAGEKGEKHGSDEQELLCSDFKLRSTGASEVEVMEVLGE